MFICIWQRVNAGFDANWKARKGKREKYFQEAPSVTKMVMLMLTNAAAISRDAKICIETTI